MLKREHAQLAQSTNSSLRKETTLDVNRVGRHGSKSSMGNRGFSSAKRINQTNTVVSAKLSLNAWIWAKLQFVHLARPKIKINQVTIAIVQTPVKEVSQTWHYR